MVDRISSLPDEALCYILSFLPTKVAVATSVLSKRWKLLWRSVPTLDFDYCDYRNDIHENRNETYSRFVHSVYAFILSRELDQPLQRFCLRCEASLCDTATVSAWLTATISTWLTAAAQCRVEHLDLYLSVRIDIPLAVISCKTLVVLKLTELKVNALSSVDFPSLKILHLDCVEFSERRHLAELLSGSPNLEDLETKVVDFIRDETGGTFKRLPKLRRAFIIFNAVPLEVVYNVQFLYIHDLVGEDIEEHIPEFHNLTHIEFTYFDYYEYGLDVFQVLRCCPKLQHLSIDKKNLELSPDFNLGEDWPCPECVPKCISLHLKTCCLVKYTGTGGEFEFAKYIMQNARVLQDMTICTHTTEEEQEQLEMMKEKFELIKELSLCTRISPA